MGLDKSHIYEYEVDPSSKTAAAAVVRMVGHNKRVLEVGAGPGSITKILKQNNGCRVTGIEIDSTAIAKLSKFCDVVHQCDLNAPDWVSKLSVCGTFDVIVAADVFEHLYDPQNCLSALNPFLSETGYIVVSLPHVGNNAVIASILDGDFEYRDYGLLDRTHIRFFGIKNMQQLFEKSGYKILDAEFIIYPPDQTELALHWQKLPGRTKSVLAHNRYGSIYQVVMKVVPATSPGDGIQLKDLPFPKYATTPISFIKAWLRGFMGERVCRVLRRGCSRIHTFLIDS